jgi:hypothetical protein
MPLWNPKPMSDHPLHPNPNLSIPMKASIIRLATLGFASLATVLLSSCETTGDPSTGGIFWSENKAQGRLAERQDKLESIEKQTGKTQRKSAQTQRQIDQLR